MDVVIFTRLTAFRDAATICAQKPAPSAECRQPEHKKIGDEHEKLVRRVPASIFIAIA
jgi:hypothetical protein